MSRSNDDTMDRMVSSPACLPQLELEEVLAAFRKLGFGSFEAFTGWCRSHLDLARDPKDYLAVAGRYEMRFTSMHLPAVNDDFDTTLARAVGAARFAQAIGAETVLFKANSRENYIRAGRPFLDAIEREGITVTPVLQNHYGTPISSLDDFREVIEGIDDPRMKTLLEVGHFQRAGISWRQGYDLLCDSIALVHVNDIKDGKSVPHGTGEVDFPGLMAHLREVGYAGRIVVELELAKDERHIERTLHHLGEAVEYLKGLL